MMLLSYNIVLNNRYVNVNQNNSVYDVFAVIKHCHCYQLLCISILSYRGDGKAKSPTN